MMIKTKAATTTAEIITALWAIEIPKVKQKRFRKFCIYNATTEQ